jgi:hypothetical protein
MRITLIGGPTAILEINGLRLLTDPTFDTAGSEYARGPVVLRKTEGPACGSWDLEPIDAVRSATINMPTTSTTPAGRFFPMYARSSRPKSALNGWVGTQLASRRGKPQSLHRQMAQSRSRSRQLLRATAHQASSRSQEM